jgi:hypothetical protein
LQDEIDTLKETNDTKISYTLAASEEKMKQDSALALQAVRKLEVMTIMLINISSEKCKTSYLMLIESSTKILSKYKIS